MGAHNSMMGMMDDLANLWVTPKSWWVSTSWLVDGTVEVDVSPSTHPLPYFLIWVGKGRSWSSKSLIFFGAVDVPYSYDMCIIVHILLMCIPRMMCIFLYTSPDERSTVILNGLRSLISINFLSIRCLLRVFSDDVHRTLRVADSKSQESQLCSLPRSLPSSNRFSTFPRRDLSRCRHVWFSFVLSFLVISSDVREYAQRSLTTSPLGHE